jgi:CheY-like chemotaxis protein
MSNNTNNIRFINNSSDNSSDRNNRVYINDFVSSNSSIYKLTSETSSIQCDSDKTVIIDDSDNFRLDFDNSKNLSEEIEKIRSNNKSIFFSALNNYNINCNNSGNNNFEIKLKSRNNNNSNNSNKKDTGISQENTNHGTLLNHNSDNNTIYFSSRIKNSLKLAEVFNSDSSNNCALQKLNSNSRQRLRKKLSKFSEKKQQISAEKSQKNKILIADDQKFTRSALRFLVEKILKENKKNDFEILECCDGIDILNEIIQDQSINNTIRCILTDENMEYLNGSNTVSILRDMQSSNKIKKIPIACLTAYDDSFNHELIYKAGVDLILSKPCTEKSLLKFFEDSKVFQ